MEKQVDDLVNKTWAKFKQTDDSRRLLIAVAGIPGSGKTTLASTLAANLNTIFHQLHHARSPNLPKVDAAHPDPSQPDIAVAIPLDGYHLTRKQLSEMPNAEEAVFRRGAAFTFDADGYSQLVEKLRKPLEATTPTIRAPSFDHAKKDPVDDDIGIPSSARIVILEGNYVALNQKPWSDAAELMDLIVFVDVSYETATVRLVKRHVAAGISPDADHALKRVRESDMRNGREIVEGKVNRIDVTIKSINDDAWKGEGEKKAEEMHLRGEVTGAEELLKREGMERKDSLRELAESGAGM